MKKILANVALMGSILISAAVLAPLFLQNESVVMWQDGVALLLSPADLGGSGHELTTRADLTTGLLTDLAETDACSVNGGSKDLICTMFGP